MEIRFYFNLNFQNYVTRNTGSGGFYKITASIAMPDSMFCAMYSKDTKKTSIQKFGRYQLQSITGLDRDQCFAESRFLSDIIETLSEEDFSAMFECVLEMPRSFRNYLAGNVGKCLSASERAEVYQELDKITKHFNDERGRRNSCPADTEIERAAESVLDAFGLPGSIILDDAAEKGDWEGMGDFISNIPSDEIVQIVECLSKSPDNKLYSHSREWRVVNVNGRLELQSRPMTRNSGDTSKNTVKTRPLPPPRKTEKMAVIINAKGLTEFVGNFPYKIIHESSGYITVGNLLGEARELSRGRLKIIDVFTEPPKVEEDA